jgi:predicted DNA-binding transcriptional regulator YafY
MYSTDNKWILVAWCYLRKEVRAFRIDRIQSFKILEEKFEDRKFDIRDYFASHPYANKPYKG